MQNKQQKVLFFFLFFFFPAEEELRMKILQTGALSSKSRHRIQMEAGRKAYGAY